MYEIIPSVKRLFIYIFIIMGMTWLGVANYYYFAEEDIKFKGALITGIMLFILGSIFGIWEYCRPNNIAKQNNLSQLLMKAFPVLLALFYKTQKQFMPNMKIAKVLAFGTIILLAVFLTSSDRKNKT